MKPYLILICIFIHLHKKVINVSNNYKINRIKMYFRLKNPFLYAKKQENYPFLGNSLFACS
ncbi:hypothetical protein COO01_05465 [Bacillus toyonensis]|nr:hypothetical protein COO01_05465 [Bacillus toyonensis]